MNASIVPAKNAKLPVSYERAREALEKCEKIDECKEWADKAAALASYAKQADDDTLFKTAMRIKGRAVRRMGELLKQIEPKPGARTDLKPRDADGPRLETRSTIAESAGLSERQAKDALRVASIPKREFEKAIEAAAPPTITALAKQGTKPAPRPPPRTDHLKGRDPKDFTAATRAQGVLRDFVRMSSEINPSTAVRGALPHERPKMLEYANAATQWLDELRAQLRKAKTS